VLLKSVERGDLDIDGFLGELQAPIQAGFRLSEDVYLEAVRRAREIVGE